MGVLDKSFKRATVVVIVSLSWACQGGTTTTQPAPAKGPSSGGTNSTTADCSAASIAAAHEELDAARKAGCEATGGTWTPGSGSIEDTCGRCPVGKVLNEFVCVTPGMQTQHP